MKKRRERYGSLFICAHCLREVTTYSPRLDWARLPPGWFENYTTHEWTRMACSARCAGKIDEQVG